jgi:hypothetical protein
MEFWTEKTHPQNWIEFQFQEMASTLISHPKWRMMVFEDKDGTMFGSCLAIS